MKILSTSLVTLGFVGMSVLPIAAQELKMENSGSNVEVVSSQGTETTAGMAGGLGTAAAVGGVALLFAVALSGDSSSSTPTTPAAE